MTGRLNPNPVRKSGDPKHLVAFEHSNTGERRIALRGRGLGQKDGVFNLKKCRSELPSHGSAPGLCKNSEVRG